MHELSIAQAVVRAVEAEAVRHGARRVLAVRLSVGALTDLDPEALRFGWEVITGEGGLPPGTGGLLSGAALQIDRVPVTVSCRTCGCEGPARPPGVLCGACGSHQTRVLTGEELDVTEVELDVPEG